jgi:transcriptional regulator GlxA family with amidase domain
VDVVILIFDQLTALDAVGPYEVLSRVPDARVRFVAIEPGPMRTDTGALALIADHGIDVVSAADILVIPGGPGEADMRRRPEVLDWVSSIHATTRWTASVCTGALLLAAAGLLDGLPATTHWLARDTLRELGAQPRPDRVVVAGRIITAAGVSAGIDMALRLVQLEFGDDVAAAIQLGIEYDPQPPLDAGSPDKAPRHIVEALRRRSRFLVDASPAPR